MVNKEIPGQQPLPFGEDLPADLGDRARSLTEGSQVPGDGATDPAAPKLTGVEVAGLEAFRKWRAENPVAEDGDRDPHRHDTGIYNARRSKR